MPSFMLIARPAPCAPAGRAALLAAGAVLLLWLAPTFSSAGGMLELADLLSNPKQYDRQMVSVTGRVTNLRVAKDRAGKNVYGFLLQEGENLIKVFAVGRASIHEGDYIVVEGVFHRLRRAGRTPSYNQIKANLIRSLERLYPDLIG